jgi:Tol biopolymer transport system component
MTIAPGTRLGPYEIVSRIGAGGMGEVWKAIDTRLDRNVAVKVLPMELAQNAQFRLRFEREAKTISQLSHPNICTLHDIGEERPQLSGTSARQSDSVSYLVMELLEGESLAERLTRGPLAIAEVLRYGAQIADALDRAHRAGVVHRDLKPGNIMLTKSGAKLLDFGLAKPSAPGVFAVAASGLTIAREDATQQRPLTTEGTIVGTFQYMAPEQLEGQDVDARTDIFSFGAVLYEMATGIRAFDGKTRTSLIAAIVGSMPRPITELQPVTPRALDHVVMKALAKDPADRWQSAHDLGDELRWIGEGSSSATAVAAAPAPRKRIAPTLVVTMLALAMAGLFAALWLRNRGAARHLVADIAPPPKTFFANVGDSAAPPVISPDGKYIVFGAGDTTIQLWLRTIATGEVRPLTATDDATFPFWSPDSRSIGFFANGHVERVDVTGGAPTLLAECSTSRGGAWSPDGVIVFALSTLTPLSRVPDRGGVPRTITKLAFPRETTHRWPSFLPDGKHFLYLAANHQDLSGGSNSVFVGSVDGGPSRLVMNGAGNAVYASGRLLFMRDTTLYAQKMSKDGVLSGEPDVVAEDVLNDGGIWRGGFSASGSGDLVYCVGQAFIQSRLVWVDRSGKELSTFGPPDRYWDVHLSPDRKKIVFSKGNPGRSIWIGDLQSGTQTRLDLGAKVHWAGFPVWSPDGSRIVANAISDQGASVVVTTIDGPAHVFPLSDDQPTETMNASFLGVTASPDGKTLGYSAFNAIWKITLDGKDRRRLTPEGIDSRSPRFSPDGASLAYVSAINGHYDVFVSPLDNMTQRVQVSYNGGTNAVWRADGSELYFIDADQQLVAVPIHREGSSLTAGQPARLFRLRGAFLGQVYDASIDGQRFLVNKMPDSTSVGVRLMTDWQAAMKSR